MLRSAVRTAWRHLPFKLPLLRALRSVVTPPESIYRHLHFEGDFDVEVAPGARFCIHSFANQVENDLFWSGYAGRWEPVSLDLWRKLCGGAETVFDIGANTGAYALAAAALNPGARVIAFEPVRRVCERLRRNAALNGGRVAVEEVAVSDRGGSATLYDTDAEHVYSASLDHSMLGASYSRSYEVPTIALDDYCAERGIGRVDLVKIDVERHEAAVFRGFRRVLAESRPSLLVEILDRELGAAVAAEIAGHGYLAYAIQELGAARGALPVTTFGDAERNYLFCQPEVACRLGLPVTAPDA